VTAAADAACHQAAPALLQHQPLWPWLPPDGPCTTQSAAHVHAQQPAIWHAQLLPMHLSTKQTADLGPAAPVASWHSAQCLQQQYVA
jgi:hypothetical protein